MTYNLFIDDERWPPADGREWTIARSSEEAIHTVKMFGVPSFISYDHDLCGDDTSMKFIHWLVDSYLDGTIASFPTSYYVHSQNPIGAANIRGYLDGFINSGILNDEKS